MVTKRTYDVYTKRLRIAELSQKYADSALTTLNGYMDESWLEASYQPKEYGPGGPAADNNPFSCTIWQQGSNTNTDSLNSSKVKTKGHL
jgi:hypothetical protein